MGKAERIRRERLSEDAQMLGEAISEFVMDVLEKQPPPSNPRRFLIETMRGKAYIVGCFIPEEAEHAAGDADERPDG